MTCLTYETCDTYRIAILLKSTSFDRTSITTNYVVPLNTACESLDKKDYIAYSLQYNASGKAPVKYIKTMLDNMLPDILADGIEYIYCADANFFKVLSGHSKAEVHLGYSQLCKYKGYENIKLVLGVNHTSVIYHPLNQNKLDLSLKALSDEINGKVSQYTKNFLTSAEHITRIEHMQAMLETLLDKPVLAVDVETFSLKHNNASLGTIGFAWSETEGVAMSVDYKMYSHGKYYGKQVLSILKRKLLRRFFEKYTGKLIFHNASFDIKILVYSLFMDSLGDTRGLLTGLDCLTRNFDDTKLISYLALNTTAEDLDLSLKGLAHSYAGNYAKEDIKNICLIPLSDLLEYNIIDCCCTVWVYNTYFNTLADTQQVAIYEELLLPSVKTIVQMELTGMPLCPARVARVKYELQLIAAKHMVTIKQSESIIEVQAILKEAAHKKDYADRVGKAKKPEKIKEKDFDTFPDVVFNPASTKHMQALLYDLLKLPIIEKTDKGFPACGAGVIEKLFNHTKDTMTLDLLSAIIGYSKVQKILNTFITAFEQAISHDDGASTVYLHGSFNIGSTVSGRLSSSNPNLQNLPANSLYGKLIKSCFQPDNRELFVGADFNALEAVVNALTTQDPNKLTVYENNLDSHCWNTFGYWPDKMPDIKAQINLSKQSGKFYKQKQEDGSYRYFHESEL